MILTRGCRISKGVNRKILKSRMMSQNFKKSLKLESEVNQTEHEDIKEDQIAENLTTKFNMEDKSDKDQSVELGNQSTVLVLAQEDLFTEAPHIDFICGDEQRIVKVSRVIVQLLQLKFLKVQSHIHTKFGHQKKQCVKPTSN